MPAIDTPLNKDGDFFVDYEEKVFEDVQAIEGEKALVTFHTVAFEGSIGFVNMLLLYGPGVNLGIQRGFPTLGDEAFPGHQNYTNQLKKFMTEGGKIYACRFALQGLYGHGEANLIEGIQPISPLDVLDLKLLHMRDNSVVIDTWTM
jgi:predicted peroxiredoxin